MWYCNVQCVLYNQPYLSIIDVLLTIWLAVSITYAVTVILFQNPTTLFVVDALLTIILTGSIIYVMVSVFKFQPTNYPYFL